MVDIRARQIKLKEHLGIVMSDASTRKFSFFVTPLEGKLSIEEGSYVLVSHPFLGDSYPVLGQVIQLKNYEEVVGSSLREKAVQTTAVGKILGYVELKGEKKILRQLFSPPTPGSKVYLPYLKFVEDIFCRNQEGQRFKKALHMGRLESMANITSGSKKFLNFFLDADEFTKQHYLISAMSGAGKTHTAAVLVEELANKTSIPVVVFDPNAEYLQIGISKENLQKKILREQYRFDFKVSFYGDISIISGLSEIKEKNRNINLKPLSNLWIKNSGFTKKSQMLEEFKNNLNSSKVTIIDSKILDFDESKKLFSSCLKLLMKYRTKESINPFILIIEDVNLIDSKLLERLATGSRKIGISMVLLTQHPSELKSKVISQMGTQIMGRTTNKQDLSCLTHMALDKLEVLPKLGTGEWIINGITLDEPKKVIVRERYSVKTLNLV